MPAPEPPPSRPTPPPYRPDKTLVGYIEEGQHVSEQAPGAKAGDAALIALRAEVEAAHTHVQNAQRIVYGDGTGRLPPVKVRRRVPYALNRAQSTLIKLLVHENWPRA
jgi:hypothetical protein